MDGTRLGLGSDILYLAKLRRGERLDQLNKPVSKALESRKKARLSKPPKNPWRFNHITDDVDEFYKTLKGPKVLLDNLSNESIARKTGPKNRLKPGEMRKLTRIFREGGVVCINVDHCDPKDFLTFNGIQAFYEEGINIDGVEEGPVHKDVWFIFVSKTKENLATQLGSDGLGRGVAYKDSNRQPTLEEKETISIERCDNLSSIDQSVAVIDMNGRPSHEWKSHILSATICNSEIGYFELERIQQVETVCVTNIGEITDLDSMMKILKKAGITKLLIHSSTKSLQQETMVIDETLELQDVGMRCIDQDGASEFVEVRVDRQRVEELLSPTVFVNEKGKLNQVNSLIGVRLILEKDVTEQQKSLLRAMGVQYTFEDIRAHIEMAEEIEGIPIVMPANLSLGRIVRDSPICIEWVGNRPYLGDKYTWKSTGLYKALKAGLSITLMVNGPVDFDLINLSQNPPVAMVNGSFCRFEGARVKIQQISQFQPDIIVERHEPKEGFSDLGSHSAFYKSVVEGCLTKCDRVKLHGPPGCGKTHLAGVIASFSIISINGSTTTEDIIRQAAFMQWLQQGGLLVLDEYNLARRGTLDFLRVGCYVDVEGDLYPINSKKHQILFLGNDSSVMGRQDHHVGGVLIEMNSPSFESILKGLGLNNDGIPEEKRRYLEEGSMRDLLTLVELREQSYRQLDQDLMLDFVYKKECKAEDLGRVVHQFLIYVDQGIAKGKRALYISGEPGIGKDHQVKSQLDLLKRSYRHMTLGAMMDIDAFKSTADECYEKEIVLLVSECSAAPSSVLEYLNAMLANPCDSKTQFAVIATDNKGAQFKGREELSEAFLNRMIEKEVNSIESIEEMIALRPDWNNDEMKCAMEIHLMLQKSGSPVTVRNLDNFHKLKTKDKTLKECAEQVYDVYPKSDEVLVQINEEISVYESELVAKEQLRAQGAGTMQLERVLVKEAAEVDEPVKPEFEGKINLDVESIGKLPNKLSGLQMIFDEEGKVDKYGQAKRFVPISVVGSEPIFICDGVRYFEYKTPRVPIKGLEIEHPDICDLLANKDFPFLSKQEFSRLEAEDKVEHIMSMVDWWKKIATYDQSEQTLAGFNEALKQKRSLLPVYLENFKGICRHHAVAFAVTLKQLYDLNLRLLRGRRVDNGDQVSGVKHLVVEWVYTQTEDQVVSSCILDVTPDRHVDDAMALEGAEEPSLIEPSREDKKRHIRNDVQRLISKCQSVRTVQGCINFNIQTFVDTGDINQAYTKQVIGLDRFSLLAELTDMILCKKGDQKVFVEKIIEEELKLKYPRDSDDMLKEIRKKMIMVHPPPYPPPESKLKEALIIEIMTMIQRYLVNKNPIEVMSHDAFSRERLSNLDVINLNFLRQTTILEGFLTPIEQRHQKEIESMISAMNKKQSDSEGILFLLDLSDMNLNFGQLLQVISQFEEEGKAKLGVINLNGNNVHTLPSICQFTSLTDIYIQGIHLRSPFRLTEVKAESIEISFPLHPSHPPHD